VKPLPYGSIRTKFPGTDLWTWAWGDDEDYLDSLRLTLEHVQGPVAFDTETTSLVPQEAAVVAVSFAWAGETGIGAATICFSDADTVPEWLEDWIENDDRHKVLANAKYDWQILQCAWGLELRGVIGDTMLMSQMFSDDERFHNIDALALRWCELEKIPTAHVLGSGKDFVGWGPVPRSLLAEYANEDVVATLMVYEKLCHSMDLVGLLPLAQLEMEVLPVVARMELNGVKLDTEALAEMTGEFVARRDEALARARVLATDEREKIAEEKTALFEKLDEMFQKMPRGTATEAFKKTRVKARAQMRSAKKPINLGSTPQLQELLYKRWNLHRNIGMRHPPQTKKKNPSTDNEVLEKLAPYSEFVGELLKYRQVAKLISTYTEKMPLMVSGITGRLHGTFWQCGARTGRFTSSDPNLQNIPNRTDEGRRIRTAFIPEPGHVLIAADYSQIEPRVAAHLSGEQVWIDAYLNGEDLYIATARAIWGDDRVRKDRDQCRQLAKTVTLAALYGAGPTKIAGTARIPFEEACNLLDAFWEALPCLRAFMDENIQLARDTGYVWTMDMLRRRHIPDIKAKHGGKRKGAENQAGNTPVQGTAADILKRAMVTIGHEGLDKWLLLQVHDELVFEVPAEEVEDASARIIAAMEGAAELVVPLKVELAVGENWAEAH
jgi:DNA polymerase-1